MFLNLLGAADGALIRAAASTLSLGGSLMPNKITRIDAPPITFSEWTLWSDRARLRRGDGRPWLGLYLWGYFENIPPSGVPYPDLPEQVIYVGETKHLDRRPLTEPHHRLVHYRDTFRDDLNLDRLYLSICRVHSFPGGYRLPDAKTLYDVLRVYTQFIEAKIYWEYTQRWGHPPALHYKKSNKRGDGYVAGATQQFVGRERRERVS